MLDKGKLRENQISDNLTTNIQQKSTFIYFLTLRKKAGLEPIAAQQITLKISGLKQPTFIISQLCGPGIWHGLVGSSASGSPS